jgi:hypothetical protein
MEQLIVTKTVEQIRQHDEWYEEYLKLKNLRALALKKWREEKEVSNIYKLFK